MPRIRSRAALFVLLFFLLVLPSAAWAQRPAAQALPQVARLFEENRDQVVSVQTEMAAPQGSINPFFNPNPGAPSRGQGSGFIVDESGLIVTNWHVVSDAQTIQVSLASGDVLSAQLIGADPATDLALLRVSAPFALPAVRLGTASDIEPGQWVVAIGSPFGLEHSVTVGVLSATGRALGMGPYDNFLQTDASINPGNSGGPLFNLNGEVVGVNTAIIRGGQGIGFAVPVDVVTEILDQLRDPGYVSRGFIGAGVQELSEALATTFNVAPRSGALVRSVEANSPAARAGLEPGDIITAFNQATVTEPADLLRAVGRVSPGSEVKLSYLREGQAASTDLTVAERPDPTRAQVERARGVAPKPFDGRLGVFLSAVTPRNAGRAGGPAGVGVLVERVEAGSPASGILRPGDVILSIAGIDTHDPREVPRVLQRQPAERPIRILLRRGGEPLFVAVRLKTS
ncbi:trypsin-like peptidase domain-containing protein [Lujinxingia litoralis]|nr:trypsin-like peptidase domain-containing protein [Lujinxingia litoralis]